MERVCGEGQVEHARSAPSLFRRHGQPHDDIRPYAEHPVFRCAGQYDFGAGCIECVGSQFRPVVRVRRCIDDHFRRSIGMPHQIAHVCCIAQATDGIRDLEQ